MVVSATPEDPFPFVNSEMPTDGGTIISLSHQARPSHVMLSVTTVHQNHPCTSELVSLSYQIKPSHVVASRSLIFHGHAGAIEILCTDVCFRSRE